MNPTRTTEPAPPSQPSSKKPAIVVQCPRCNHCFSDELEEASDPAEDTPEARMSAFLDAIKNREDKAP